MLQTDATRLPRIMECNGSRLMPPSFPQVEDDPTARDEGIAAHYMAQQVFNNMFQLEEMVDRKAPNGFYMTYEMAEHVQSYLSALDCGEMEVCTDWSGEGFFIGGRADHIKYIAHDEPGNHYGAAILRVDDFKYGWRIVEPEGNWTLISHAISYCITHNIVPVHIILTIHQPRPHHPDGKTRSWTITYAELLEYHARIAATLSNPSDTLRTGLAWCAGCHALATCPAARKAGMNAIDATDVAFTDDISDGLLSYELDTLRTASATLENRLNALEEMAKHRLRNGAIMDNYALEHQFGNRRFKPGFDAPMIGAMIGIDATNPGTITPAEAERRLVANGKVKEEAIKLVAMLSERPQTGVKLVRSNINKRAERLLAK